MPTVRARGRLSDVLLVPARELRSVSDPAVARELARARLRAQGRGEGLEASAEEEEALVRALLQGDLVLVPLPGAPRLMHEPRARELSSLLEPGGSDGVPEPPPTVSWIGVEVVDQRGRPLPMFSVRVDDPTGARHEARLDEGGRARVEGLRDDGACTVTLRARGDDA